MEKKHLSLSLGCSGLIVLLECYVETNAYFGYVGGPLGKSGAGNLMFRFFTEDSNLLLGLSCLLYLIYGLLALQKDQAIPNWVKLVKLIATTATTTTFMVVLVFLAPMVAINYQNPLYYFAMFSWPNMTFTHFVCPALAVVSFLLFEEPMPEKNPHWKTAFWTLLTVGTYAVIVGTLASLHQISEDESVNNVYGFMDATVNPWGTTLAIVLIFALTYGEGVGLLYAQNAIRKKEKAKAQA
jgi:hypothetical protein